MTHQNVSFDNLPEEVMENIIIYCDGISLGNLLKTCKRWKQCIEEPKKYVLKKWGLVCMHEIKQDFIIDILQNLYPKYWLGKEICWKSVYKCWRQWSHLNRWPRSIEIFQKKTSNCISTIKFSGDWIFIATNNEGALEAINYTSGKKVLLYNQCSSIQDIYLRCYLSKDAEDMILDGVEHDELVMAQMYYYACFDLHSGQVTHKPKLRNFSTLKHFEGQEVYAVNDNSPSKVFSMNVITKNKVAMYRDELSFCSILQVWNGSILLFDYERTDSEAVCEVTDYSFQPKDHPFTNCKLKVHDYLLCSKRYHHHLGVIMTINDVAMEINVNGNSRKYAMFSHLACRIMCTLYHAGVLFLGSDIGVIYTYRVSSDEDLLRLNLSQYDCCLDIDSQPIVAIDVKETSTKPIIAAASERNIRILRFD